MRLKHEIRIDREKCVGCGRCVRDCPSANLAVTEGKAAAMTDGCILCGHCEAICPRAAVELTGFPADRGEFAAAPVLDPDKILLALRSRRSIRRFRPTPIPRETIDRIVEAGRLTPTAKNEQDVRYVVLRQDLAECERLAVNLFRRASALLKPFSATLRRVRVDDRFFFKGAPLAIVVAAKNDINGALAASNMALTAEACGLGVLYSGFFCTAARLSGKLKKRLGIMKKYKAVATLVLGTADVTYLRPAPKEEAEATEL